MSKIGVDPACYDLADHFLNNCDPKPSPNRATEIRTSLAEHIQRAVEDWYEAQNWEPR